MSFRLYNTFSSSMVLQRGEPIHFAGAGEAGRSYEISFAGQIQRGEVLQDGTWQMEFPALAAGGPYELQAGYAGEEPSVVMDDILIGDVWYCSGQSNMEMPVLSHIRDFWFTDNAEEEAANANYPQIRICNCLNHAARTFYSHEIQQEEMDGIHWERCTPDSIKLFSACAYFFGRKLHQDLNIPIGLVSNAVGASRMEAWISRRKLQEYDWNDPSMPEYSTPERIEQMWQSAYDNDSLVSRNMRQWQQKYDELGKPCAEWLQVGYDDSEWKSESGTMLKVPAPSRTVFRLTFTLPDDFKAEACRIHIGQIDDCDHAYMNGTFIGETTVRNFACWAVDRRYPIPEGCLKPGKNVLSVILDDQCNFGYINAAKLSLEFEEFTMPLAFTAKSRTVFVVPKDFPPRPSFPISDAPEVQREGTPNYASTLFNTLVNPWFNYRFKGAIWYQGCTNSGPYTYYKLHRMMIEELREKWNKPHFPFILVQLAGFFQNDPAHPRPVEAFDDPCSSANGYALIREAQHEVAKQMADTGMITAFDRGDPNDIHPHDKQTIGYRLALKAESMLGLCNSSSDSPELAAFQNHGTYAKIILKNADGLHTLDGLPPKGFTVAGPTGIFHPATARIQDNAILLTCPELISIVHVRYAFCNFCCVNTVNKDGWPLLPFRTDKIDYSTWI